jgi:hypothetical protein
MKEQSMKNNAWKFVIAALLVAVLAAACVAPFTPPPPPEEPEFDAQGRRLVTVSVDVGNAARAVNTAVARANLDFFEVVLKSSVTGEYYSATTTNAAGNKLSLRLPEDSYLGYLSAGYLDADGKAVLLAYDDEINVSSPATISAGGTNSIVFTLAAATSSIGTTSSATTVNPGTITATTVASPTAVNAIAKAWVPYFPLAEKILVKVVVPGNSTNTILGNATDIDVKALNYTDKTNKATLRHTIIFDTPTPASVAGLNVSFNVDASSFTSKGLVKIGFDIPVTAFDDITNRPDAIVWHFRNGLDTTNIDIATANADNTGGAILFGLGGAEPSVIEKGVDVIVTPPSTIP